MISAWGVSALTKHSQSLDFLAHPEQLKLITNIILHNLWLMSKQPKRRLREIQAMTSIKIEPKLGAESFSCAHCNAVAHHDWFSLFLKPEDDPAEIIVHTLEAAMLAKNKENYELINGLKHNVLTYEYQEPPRTLKVKLMNLYVSRCYSCRGFAIWVRDQLVFPIREGPPDIIEGDFKEVIEGNSKKAEEHKTADDIEEAAAIVNRFPDGAAALIRVCIRKMMPLLEQSGKKLDDHIFSLVHKGLEVEIQQSMDRRHVLRQNPLKPTQFDEERSEAATRMFDSLKEILKGLKKGDEK